MATRQRVVFTLQALLVAGCLQIAGSGLADATENQKPNGATECDRLAAYPDDSDKVAEGIAWDNLDPRMAVPACQQALSKSPNNPRLMYQLGRSLDKAKRFDESIRWYRKAAEQGYSEAQFRLGVRYLIGKKIVAKDYSKAFKWFRKAAEQGHARAQGKLGDMYDQGKSVRKDRDKAISWWKKAALQGNKFAIDRLAGLGLSSSSTENLETAANSANSTARPEIPTRSMIVSLIRKSHPLYRNSVFAGNNEQEFVASCRGTCESEATQEFIQGRDTEAMCELYCVCNAAEFTYSLTTRELNFGLLAGEQWRPNTRLGQVLRHARMHCTSVVFFGSDEDPTLRAGRQRRETMKRLREELTLAPLSDQLRAKYGLQNQSISVVVTRVTPDGIAAAKGMREGDVIIRINKRKVSETEEAFRHMHRVLQNRDVVHLEMDGAGGHRCFVLVKKDGEVDYEPPETSNQLNCGPRPSAVGGLSENELYLLCYDAADDEKFCQCFTDTMMRSPLSTAEKIQMATLRREKVATIYNKYGTLFFERCQK
jgi:hypothetical protein